MTLIDYIKRGVVRRLCPDYRLIDGNRILFIETEYGRFVYTKQLQDYHDLFEQVDEYKVDIKNDDVVLDIGAYVGASTLLFSRSAKHVIAVEPVFFSELVANIELNQRKNVTCLPYALGLPCQTDTIDAITFNGRTAHVQYISMREILEKCPYQPTILKTDCEGGEYGIGPDDLRGIRLVVGEVHVFDTNGSTRNPYTFINTLRTCGFTVDHYRTQEGQTMIHAVRGEA